MPKVTIKFNLPEEQEEFELINNAPKNEYILHRVKEYLRRKSKSDLDKKEQKIINDIINIIYEDND